MSEKKKVRRVKKKRRMTPFMKLVCVAIIALSGYLIYLVTKEFARTVELRKELAEVREKLQEIQDENNFLNNEKAKLQDPDYIENYARGNYMLSKEGEQIFYLPADKED